MKPEIYGTTDQTKEKYIISSNLHSTHFFSYILVAYWRHLSVQLSYSTHFYPFLMNTIYIQIVAVFDETDAEQKQKQTCCNPTGCSDLGSHSDLGGDSD